MSYSHSTPKHAIFERSLRSQVLRTIVTADQGTMDMKATCEAMIKKFSAGTELHLQIYHVYLVVYEAEIGATS